MSYRVHVIQVSTSLQELFLYSHYSDQGHDPNVKLSFSPERLLINCTDLFKLKPNIQKFPKDRVDIYIPCDAAISAGEEIIHYYGGGTFYDATGTDPESFRRGKQNLPIIKHSKSLNYLMTRVQVAGHSLSQRNYKVFVDQECPNFNFVEMKGKEVHVGIDLSRCSKSGMRDPSQIQLVYVPSSELRTAGERNPIEKAYGLVQIELDYENAKKFGIALLELGSL